MSSILRITDEFWVIPDKIDSVFVNTDNDTIEIGTPSAVHEIEAQDNWKPLTQCADIIVRHIRMCSQSPNQYLDLRDMLRDS